VDSLTRPGHGYSTCCERKVNRLDDEHAVETGVSSGLRCLDDEHAVEAMRRVALVLRRK
jgi:hypothetical protein